MPQDAVDVPVIVSEGNPIIPMTSVFICAVPVTIKELPPAVSYVAVI